MPVAHGLLQAGEDVERAFDDFTGDLWEQPGGAASPGWHLVHLIGSTDRLFTYAHGEGLDTRQREWLEVEKSGRSELGPGDLLAVWKQVVDRCLEALRGLEDDSLLEAREVGAARLPSTALGLLFHAAEHAQRHSGQIFTTLKIMNGSQPSE